MLANISAPVPPAPALAPPTPTTAPLGPASVPPDDDEMLGEDDLDLADFWCILFLFEKYYNTIWSVIKFEYLKYFCIIIVLCKIFDSFKF